MKIKLIPEKENCRFCGKDLSEESQDTLIDQKSGERFAYCESCFKNKVIPELKRRNKK